LPIVAHASTVDELELRMNNEVEKVRLWTLANKLTIIATKTNALVVFPTTKIPPRNILFKYIEVSITIQDTLFFIRTSKF